MEGYFENPQQHFLDEPMLFLLALKQNLQEKAFFSVKTKVNPNFAVKLAGEEQPFVSTAYLMNQIFQTYVFLIRDNGIYNRTELIVQKYQKVQKLLTSHSSTELNKTDFLCDYHKKITQVMPRF